MSIELIAEPGKVYAWEQFRSQKPAYSIALDGIVSSPTMRDPSGPYANFDHHTGVDRLSARSTSEQVYLEINLGLFDSFRRDGLPRAKVYVNDPDEDTCLAWWLLKNHEKVINHASPAINRLVRCEDLLDCTAGAYPIGNTEMRRKMAWIFYPYNAARFQGKIAQMSGVEMENVIEAVEGRITQHVLGQGSEIALEGHYERIGGGDGWAMTKETGPASRMAMYNDGIKAYVTLVAKKPNDFYVYAWGKRSAWTPFNIDIERLNEIEGEIITPDNRWGPPGKGATTGGSPKLTGSRLSPKELEAEINRK